MMSISTSDAAEIIKKATRITVFTGAGISTSCGIPDFRGPEGLYAVAAKKYNLPYPEAIFEINYFKKNPLPFYDFSRDLFNGDVTPSFSHFFLAELEKLGKLNCIVTQNIDMLHEKAGSVHIVNCHGSYVRGHCLLCHKEFSFNELEDHLKKGIVKYCRCAGIVKPDIVFFGEQLPPEFFDIFENPPETDLLLVIGTSLQVQPAAMFPAMIQKTFSPVSIMLNRAPTDADQIFTYVVHNDADEFFTKVNAVLHLL